MNKLVIKENIHDYTSEERIALDNAYKQLEAVAQEGELSIEETRIRVAWVRMQSEDNFKINQPTVKASAKKKKIKEDSLDDMLAAMSGEVPVKKKRASRKKEVKEDALAKAARLNFRKMAGEELSPEDEEYLRIALAEVPEA